MEITHAQAAPIRCSIYLAVKVLLCIEPLHGGEVAMKVKRLFYTLDSSMSDDAAIRQMSNTMQPPTTTGQLFAIPFHIPRTILISFRDVSDGC